MAYKTKKPLRLISDIKLKNIEPAIVAGNSVVAAPLSAAKSEAVPIGRPIPGGQLMVATGKAFGARSAPMAIAELDDGSVHAMFDLQEDGFELGMLFKNFRVAGSDLFVFDDVKVGLERAPKKSRVDFTGVLRMNSRILKPFRKFVSGDAGLLLTGSFDLDDGESVAGKLSVRELHFRSAAKFHVNVSNDVIFSGLEFKLDVIKNESGAGWVITPSLSGSLLLAELLDDSGSDPLNCSIVYEDKTLKVSAATKEVGWKMAGLRVALQDVSVDFEAGKSKSIDVAAKLKAGRKSFELAGSLKPDFLGIFASASKFTLSDLSNLFKDVTGLELGIPEFPVKFEEITLGVASAKGKVGDHSLEQGVAISGTVNVHGHRCTATALLQSDGVQFSGSLDDIQLGPVTIVKPRLEMQFYTSKSGKDVRFLIAGSAKIQGVKVDCKLVYEKSGRSWNAIVYAGMDASKFGLSRAVPAVKGSFVDTLRFSKVAFVYATKSTSLQDPDFGFKVRKGLQLIGELDGVPGLKELTGDVDGGIILSAEFGSQIAIGIAMPESTRLQLGSSVSCDPFSMRVVLVPKPELELVFGMDVTVPKQDDPLHFDLMLAISPIDAAGSGTMKGFWVNPFGLKPLKIGPALALEIGVNYAQFSASGTPSKLAFMGGLVMGDVVAQLAVSVATNPMDMVLLGELENLSPSNLVGFVNDVSNARIPKDAVPNFFELHELKLMCAPAGGSIGTVTFEPGFSFACDLVLFDKRASAYFRLNEDGIAAKASLDQIELGPLKIGGKRGDDMLLDFELTTSRQVLKIDAEIDFEGSRIGVFVDISNKGIEFEFEQDFLGLMNFTVHGKSSGSISQPKTLDFQLTAEFNNELTQYLQTHVTQKIREASHAADTKITNLQDDLKTAEQAYKKEFEPAQQQLKIARDKATRRLQKLRDDLATEKDRMATAIRIAQDKVRKAQGEFDNAINSAKRAVNKAQVDYDNAMRDAHGEVNKAQKDYDNALAAAQSKVTTAQNQYNHEIDGAQRSVTAAQKQVDKFRASRRSVAAELDRTSGWRVDRQIALRAELASLDILITTANAALVTAQAFLNTVGRGAGFVALEGAKGILEGVRFGGKYTAFEGAKKALEATRIGGHYVALNGAKKALSAIQTGSEYTVWQGAVKSLSLTEQVGRSAVSVAQTAVADFGQSSINTAFNDAQQALEIVKTGTSYVAFDTARNALEVAKKGSKTVLKLSEAVLAHSGDVIDIRHVKLSSQLKAIQRGELFKADVDASILGKKQTWAIDFDVKSIDHFVEQMFDDAISRAAKLVV